MQLHQKIVYKAAFPVIIYFSRKVFLLLYLSVKMITPPSPINMMTVLCVLRDFSSLKPKAIREIKGLLNYTLNLLTQY